MSNYQDILELIDTQIEERESALKPHKNAVFNIENDLNKLQEVRNYISTVAVEEGEL